MPIESSATLENFNLAKHSRTESARKALLFLEPASLSTSKSKVLGKVILARTMSIYTLLYTLCLWRQVSNLSASFKPSSLNSVCKKASIISLTISSLVSTKARHKILALSHFLDRRAISLLQQSAALASLILLAAMQTPVPDQQNKIPLSTFPSATINAASLPISTHLSVGGSPKIPFKISWCPWDFNQSTTKSVKAVLSSDAIIIFIFHLEQPQAWYIYPTPVLLLYLQFARQ